MRRLLLILIPALVLVVLVAVGRSAASWRSAVVSQPGALMYVSAFDGFLEDWQTYEDGQLAARIENDALRLAVDAFQAKPYSLAQPRFGDFDLRVRARAVAGPLNNGYGVIVRAQQAETRGDSTWGGLISAQLDNLLFGPPAAQHYYLFLVSSDGYYQVAREVNGVSKEMSTWIESDAVQQGLGADNDLRVIAQGNQFQFYVNGTRMSFCVPNNPDGQSTYFGGACVDGQMLDTLVDNAGATAGQVGVIAQSFNEAGVMVEFDNLVVYGP